jgi:Dyp-type peroxidase family
MVDLNNNFAIDANDPAHRPFLERLQANILRGHGRNHARYVFGRFTTPGLPANRAALRSQVASVTSAWRQLEEERRYTADRTPGNTVCNLFLSADGYRQLGFQDSDIRQFAPEGPSRWAQSNFFEGMKQGAADLHDPSSADWQPEFQGRTDFLLLFADDDTARLDSALNAATAQLAGVASHWVEAGAALRTATEDGYEHFGYLDGRSQPVFLQEHMRDEPAISRWNPVEPLNLVLVRDGGVPGDADACGSFFVFRKLEQNVQGFVRDEQALAQALNMSPDLAGALMIGRFRDGTPVVLHDQPGAAPGFNDFAFDNSGTSRCPFHAHIRKSNPRGDQEVRAQNRDRGHERVNRIARRAIPYGASNVRVTADSDPRQLPDQGVGLLFGCFQAHIARQFAHIQKVWAFDEAHPEANAGKDPLLAAVDPSTPGQPPATFSWPSAYRSPNTIRASVRQHVKLMGGEYFFAPSLPFLRSL